MKREILSQFFSSFFLVDGIIHELRLLQTQRKTLNNARERERGERREKQITRFELQPFCMTLIMRTIAIMSKQLIDTFWAN